MVAAAVIGTVASAAIGAASSADSSRRASNTQHDAIDAQSKAASSQLELAQQQWDYQRDVYLPKSMQMADDAAALNKQVAQKQMDAADFAMGVSADAISQARKSYKYQDQYMGMTDDYASGKMANTMADEAQADTQQAGAIQRGITDRAMQRRGVDPSSGAGMALMHDDQIAESAAGAGAQTAARRMARDKAEQMVGIAAGSGQAGFGTGLTAAGLATGANNSASNASTVGNQALNSVNSGMVAGTNATQAALRGAGATGYGLGQTYGGSPFLDQIGTMSNGLLRSGAFGSGGLSGAFGTMGAKMNGSYNANYGNEGLNYSSFTGGSGLGASGFADASLGSDIGLAYGG